MTLSKTGANQGRRSKVVRALTLEAVLRAALPAAQGENVAWGS